MNRPGDRPADVAVVPGLVPVAGEGRAPPFRIAHDEAVLPGVPGEPRAGPRPAPVTVVPGRGAPRRLEVEGGPQLVLRVTGPRRGEEGAGAPRRGHPVAEGRHLVPVAAVGRLDGERRPGPARRPVHRGEIGDHQAPDVAGARHAGPCQRHEVVRCVARGEAELRVEERVIPVRRRPVAREDVGIPAGWDEPGGCGWRRPRRRSREHHGRGERDRQGAPVDHELPPRSGGHPTAGRDVPPRVAGAGRMSDDQAPGPSGGRPRSSP